MSGSAAPPGQDPSMEDILASIRKILNEEEGAQPSAAVPDDRAIRREEEPLELTEAMLVGSPAPEPPPPARPEPVEPEPIAPDPVREPEPEPPAIPAPVMPAAGPEPSPPPPALVEGLVAPATAAAAAAILGQLARTVAAERAAPVHRGGPSIEEVVREEVRPLLKAWMDAHLPALMERLVRAEIERVVSRSLG